MPSGLDLMANPCRPASTHQKDTIIMSTHSFGVSPLSITLASRGTRWHAVQRARLWHDAQISLLCAGARPSVNMRRCYTSGAETTILFIRQASNRRTGLATIEMTAARGGDKHLSSGRRLLAIDWQGGDGFTSTLNGLCGAAISICRQTNG